MSHAQRCSGHSPLNYRCEGGTISTGSGCNVRNIAASLLVCSTDYTPELGHPELRLYRFVTASVHFAGGLGQSAGALGTGGAASEQAPYPAVAAARLLPQLHAQLAAEGADDGAVAAEGQLEVEAAARGRSCARQH